jgi:hypothetical protein
MAPGQMQVDAGGLQVGVSEQHLNGGQVGPVFQQVSGEAVPEHMGANALLQASMLCRLGTGVPHGFIGQMLAVG